MQIQRGKNCPCFPTAHTGGEAGGGRLTGKPATAGMVSYILGSKGPGAFHQAPAPMNPALSLGELGPVLEHSPPASCQLGIPILIWIRSVKGSVKGGEVPDLHFRQ